MNIRLPQLQIVDRASYIVLDFPLSKQYLDDLNTLFYTKIAYLLVHRHRTFYELLIAFIHILKSFLRNAYRYIR